MECLFDVAMPLKPDKDCIWMLPCDKKHKIVALSLIVDSILPYKFAVVTAPCRGSEFMQQVSSTR